MSDSKSRISEDMGLGVATKLREIRDAGAERAQQALDDSRQMIQASPIRSVLIAFGVGALTGFLLARRGHGTR